MQQSSRCILRLWQFYYLLWHFLIQSWFQGSDLLLLLFRISLHSKKSFQAFGGQIGPDWNFSTIIGWIAFKDPLTSPLTSTTGQNFYFNFKSSSTLFVCTCWCTCKTKVATITPDNHWVCQHAKISIAAPKYSLSVLFTFENIGLMPNAIFIQNSTLPWSWP